PCRCRSHGRGTSYRSACSSSPASATRRPCSGSRRSSKGNARGPIVARPHRAGEALGERAPRARAARDSARRRIMTKRERVMAALAGKPVDRVPLAFWLHNFATENSAEGLATETLRLARTFDWDYLKPQSRAQCFAEMWGLSYRASGEKAVQYTVTHAPIR